MRRREVLIMVLILNTLAMANEEVEQGLAAITGRICVTTSTFRKVLASFDIIDSA
jgi:hypothetical protein